MVKISRIAHLTLETSEFDRQVDHYERVIGLRTIHREPGTAYLATKLGQLALVLKSERMPNCTSVAFELAPNADPAEVRRRLAEHNVTSETRTDAYPGIESLIAFNDPKGSTIELFSNGTFHQPGAVNGIGPHKLGHVAFVVDDPKEMSTFYGEVLGFRVSDWVEDFFVFMRCGPDHHTVNFLHGKPTRMHHIAFELRDAAHLVEILRSAGAQLHEDLVGAGSPRAGPQHGYLSSGCRGPDRRIVHRA